jgi:hypothetical protein
VTVVTERSASFYQQCRSLANFSRVLPTAGEQKRAPHRVRSSCSFSPLLHTRLPRPVFGTYTASSLSRCTSYVDCVQSIDPGLEIFQRCALLRRGGTPVPAGAHPRTSAPACQHARVFALRFARTGVKKMNGHIRAAMPATLLARLPATTSVVDGNCDAGADV